MKITFPHMGNTHLSIKALFDDLGVETVVPPKNSKKTLELGTKYSPELICLPLKINMGNFIESIEKGADTIVMTGSCGPCRFGYYSEVQKEILKDLGHDVEFVILEAPDGNVKEFYNRVSKIANTKNVVKIGKSLLNATAVLRKLNEFEGLVLKFRPYEKNNGDMDRLYDTLLQNLQKITGSKGMMKALNEASDHLDDIAMDWDRDILKVGIVGEIYTNIDDFANLDIGRKLNKMGVSVYKSHTASEWLLENLFFKSLGMSKEKEIIEASKPYMKTLIGGHARETIGNTLLYEKKGCHGVIQIMPFTCMPEIVVMSLMPMIQKDKNIPIMTLIIDEMTGEAGYLTRLEAFIDLLRNRKEKKENERVLSWH